MLIYFYIFKTANLPDPCYNYTMLDNPWRSTSNTYGLHSYYMCDTSVSWSGWYRLFINGLSAHIPDTCVAQYSCGTNIALWIRGGHPTVTDGVVTRDVCGYDWAITAAIMGLTPLKSKPVQATIMSMSWFIPLDAILHTVQVIIFT